MCEKRVVIFVAEKHASRMLKLINLLGSGEEEVKTQVGRDEGTGLWDASREGRLKQRIQRENVQNM